MAVLVTGVGYIGSRLVERLLAAGEEVVGVDNFFSTDPGVVESFRQRPGFFLIEGDVADEATLEAAFSAAPISTVYALAAQASAHPEAAPADYTERTNLIAPRLLLDAMLAHGVSRLVYASSFKVYGTNLPPVVDEETPYGLFGDLSHLSKCYAEKLMEFYAARHGLTALSLRLGITYGLGPVMKRDERFMTAPNKFCLQAVQGEPLDLYPGSHRMAGWIHVDDAAEVMRRAAAEDFEGYVPINAVTEVCPVADVAEAVAQAGAERGLEVEIRQRQRIEVLSPPATVVSRFPEFFEEPRRSIAGSVGELIDYWSHGSRA